MDNEQIAAIAAQLERARLTAVSLYSSCDIGSHEYDRLIGGVGGGELLLAEVARLRTDLAGALATLSQEHRATEAYAVALARAEADNATLRALLWSEPINFRHRCLLCGRAEPNHDVACPIVAKVGQP